MALSPVFGTIFIKILRSKVPGIESFILQWIDLLSGSQPPQQRSTSLRQALRGKRMQSFSILPFRKTIARGPYR
jgi:hypothetical protein